MSGYILCQVKKAEKDVYKRQQDEEADAYILKDISAPGSTEACYEMVEDEGELRCV